MSKLEKALIILLIGAGCLLLLSGTSNKSDNIFLDSKDDIKEILFSKEYSEST